MLVGICAGLNLTRYFRGRNSVERLKRGTFIKCRSVSNLEMKTEGEGGAAVSRFPLPLFHAALVAIWLKNCKFEIPLSRSLLKVKYAHQ